MDLFKYAIQKSELFHDNVTGGGKIMQMLGKA